MYSNILIWDLSRYNGRADGATDVDFAKGIAEGIQAGFYRGTVGTAGVDYKFFTYAQKSDSFGLPWSPYHAFRPLDNPLQQGVAFANLLFSGVGKKRMGQLPPIFDIEVDGGLSTSTLEYNILKMFQGYNDTVKMLNEGVAIPPMIYTSAGFWNDHLVRTTWAAQLLLWIAHWFYTGKQSVEAWNLMYPNGKPTIPRDWSGTRETFWQFSANGNQQGSRYGTTGDADLDLNWFNGTRDDFRNLFGVYPGAVTAPPPLPPPDPPSPPSDLLVIDPSKCKALNFRSKALVSTTTMRGALAAGEPVDPTGQVNGAWAEIVIPNKYWVSSYYLKKA